ncbi:uncharacterized protein GGS22DRAFT_192629 [Annulohypoxylon maeteangense]|uniref:uncharacterized protein n=1 Tax=Annulohypoxylon maeteangense TaxID=1927788 RepID=UPI002007A00D|nr:uncharacterized protein GGS22DRAFT_192629 [Annulohypoxylon maeteangense]KAI0881143.1 hypothetical protein GGS22DRAFT_192629 [Annulohypoxylon maeteangense]
MHKSKHKQKSSARPWSEPKWHEQYQQWYIERVGRNGTIEYDWIAPTPSNAPDQRVPRSDHAIDGLTEQVQNINIGQDAYDSGQFNDYGGQHATAVDQASYTHDAHQSQDPAYLDHTHPQQHSDKGKGKSLGVEHIDPYGNQSLGNTLTGAGAGSEFSAASDYRQGAHTQYPNSGYLGSEYTNVENPAASSPIHAMEPPVNSYEPVEASADAEYEEAVRRSRDEYYGAHKAGESTSYSTPLTDAGTSSSWPPTVDPNAYELNPPLANGDDIPTPRGGSPILGGPVPTAPAYPNYIQGTPGEEEVLDNRYRVEHSARFQPGEVFKILWSEPLGQVGQIGPDDPISDVTKRRTAAGSKFYVGFRRFIIVTTDESHHSTCVPILTYDRRGCLKRGVRPNKHGIIYMAGHKPRLLKNEPELGFSPVALQVYAEGETLAKESRVNYSKLVTIEHNVKVFFIGSIAQDDFDHVRYAVNECWNKKLHRSSRKSRR